MAYDLASISAKPAMKPPRILLIAKEKIGKTCFCAGDRVEGGRIVEWGLNAPVILPVKGERGADELPVPKFPVAERYEDVLEAIGSVALGEHDFQTLAVDSLTTLDELVRTKVMKENAKEFPDLAAYARYNNGARASVGLHREVCNALDYLREERGMVTIVTAHIKQTPKMIDDPDRDSYDAWVADISDPVYSVYARWCDVLLYADTEDLTKKSDAGMGKTVSRSVNVGNGARYLFTRKTKSHPSGGRGVYGHLPEKIPFDWWHFEEAVKEAERNFYVDAAKDGGGQD